MAGKPESEVEATLHSTPVDLGVIDVDATGAFAATLAIPVDVEPGAHALHLAGHAVGGAERDELVPVPLVVTSPRR